MMSANVRFPATLLFSAALACLTCEFMWGQTSDTQPPALTNLTLSPASVDVTSSPQTVTFQVTATENLSGLSYAYVYLFSPSRAQWVAAAGAFPWAGPPLLNGTVSIPAVIPRYSEPGLWTVGYLYIYDRVNNPAIYSGATLQALGYPTTVTVIDATPDLVAPQLSAIALTPAAVDVSGGPANVQVDLTITDAVSGFSQYWTGFDFTIDSPSGKQSVPLAITQFNLVSGNANSGIWRQTLQIPKHAEAGVWKVTSVFLRDAASNSRYYSPPDLAAFGSAIDVTVTSAVQDLSPPSPTAMRFIPSFVNTSLGPQTVEVEIDATDNMAGVRFAPTTPHISWIYGPFFQSPSGMQYSYVSPYGGWTLMSGSPLNGTWRGSFYLPQYSEEGTWAVQNFRMEDEARNTLLILSRQGVEALGLTATFDVIKPSLQPDGTLTSAGGTVQDSQFGSKASITFPPGAITTPTTVAIDVLQTPLNVPLPSGFSGADTFFVNIQLNPQPAFPLAPPGLTVVLPLRVQMVPGSAIYLFRINPATGLLEPSLNTSGFPVVGYVNSDGASATFTGVSTLSTVVGLKSGPIQLQIDIKPGDVINPINLKSRGVIPVAIYGTPTLDASKIDVSTLRLSGAGVSRNNKGKFNADVGDYNRDGFKDLIVHFDTQGLQLAPGASTARLDGTTLDSRVIWGQDSVRLLP